MFTSYFFNVEVILESQKNHKCLRKHLTYVSPGFRMLKHFTVCYVFLASESNPGSHIVVCCHGSFTSSTLWQFHTCLSWHCHFPRVLVTYLAPHLGLVWCSTMIRLRSYTFGKILCILPSWQMYRYSLYQGVHDVNLTLINGWRQCLPSLLLWSQYVPFHKIQESWKM